MKFICTQENLQRGLSKSAPIAGRNKQLPILSHVLLQLKEGVLHLIATDLELGAHAIVPGKVEEEGSCTIEARRLVDYVQQLPASNPVIIETKGSGVQISTGGYQAQFPVMSDDDFPLLPSQPSAEPLQLPAQAFCHGLTRAVFAAARDATRPEIHGVLVKRKGGEVVIAATDSFRLAEEMVKLPAKEGEFELLLPLAAAQEAVRLFNDQDKLALTVGEGYVVFSGSGIELSSRLVEGKYPDYAPIIPQEFNTSGAVDKEEMLRALKTLAVFLPRDSRRVYISVKPAQEKLQMQVGGSDSGEGKVEVAFEGEGDDADILFNIQYLLDGIQRLPDEKVVIRMVGGSDPVVFSPAKEGVDYKYVVMPIQAT